MYRSIGILFSYVSTSRLNSIPFILYLIPCCFSRRDKRSPKKNKGFLCTTEPSSFLILFFKSLHNNRMVKKKKKKKLNFHTSPTPSPIPLLLLLLFFFFKYLPPKKRFVFHFFFIYFLFLSLNNLSI